MSEEEYAELTETTTVLGVTDVHARRSNLTFEPVVVRLEVEAESPQFDSAVVAYLSYDHAVQLRDAIDGVLSELRDRAVNDAYEQQARGELGVA